MVFAGSRRTHDMTDPLPIVPFTGPVSGRIQLPGSKSITNRALVLAALAPGTVTLENVLQSRDSRIMIEALRALGIDVEEGEASDRVTVHGQAGQLPVAEASIDVGNAGTAARFITALVATRAKGQFALDGDLAMRERPIVGLLDALHALGAEVQFGGTPGFFPFTITARGLRGGTVDLDASDSSQMLSALLMVAPLADQSVTITAPMVRLPFVRITLAVMQAFGVRVEADEAARSYRIEAGNAYRVPGGGTYRIESDVTSSTYFQALPLVAGGRIELHGLQPETIQGDAAFTGVLRDLGLQVDRQASRWVAAAGPGPSLPQPATSILDIDFREFSDTFLTLAAISPLIGRTLRIRGIAHTRRQETDRVAGILNELRRLGQEAEYDEFADALIIHPDRKALVDCVRDARGAGEPLIVQTYEDHRFAMSFAILGSHDLLGDGESWLQIADPACCRKTFPRFFDELDMLRKTSAATVTP